MYMHNQDWDAAMRVAEQCDPASIVDVLMAQASGEGVEEVNNCLYE